MQIKAILKYYFQQLDWQTSKTIIYYNGEDVGKQAKLYSSSVLIRWYNLHSSNLAVSIKMFKPSDPEIWVIEIYPADTTHKYRKWHVHTIPKCQQLKIK